MFLILSFTFGGVFSSLTGTAQTASAWPPVSQEELELKDNPLRPGEPAMILYREIQTDSAKSLETHFTKNRACFSRPRWEKSACPCRPSGRRSNVRLRSVA
jgi:hypothetical protein